MLDRIGEAQSLAGSGAPGAIQFGEGLPPLHLQRQIPLPELRKHKRSFLKLAKSNLYFKLKDSGVAQRLFINYLKEQIAAGA